MGSKILAAVIVVIVLLVGIFLIAPNAFRDVVPDEYMPDSSSTVSDTDIHWQTRASTVAGIAVDSISTTDTVEISQ